MCASDGNINYMPKPIIITVDDELQVRNAIERDLRRHYRGDYRIVKAASGAEALDAVRQFKQRNDPVALLLVDQRMPEMSGTEFLQQAIIFYPEARKVLLTAYADTEAVIASINRIGLDYYLMKPWDPPDQGRGDWRRFGCCSGGSRSGWLCSGRPDTPTGDCGAGRRDGAVRAPG